MAKADVEPQVVRRLLSELLRSDPDFEAFCLDAFPDIHRRFSRSMERLEKENLLLLHASNRGAVILALRRRFPEAAVWRTSGASESQTSARRVALILASLDAGLLVAFFGWTMLRPSAQGADATTKGRAASRDACGALLLDDVFVVKGAGAPSAEPIALDVRLRHGGNSAPVDITRVVVECGDKTPERSPYEPSASYDLLISGAHNEAAIAQRLGPGEIDRMLIRLGFSREAAGYGYSAKLKLVYNGGCVVESAPFVLSRDAARYVGFLR